MSASLAGSFESAPATGPKGFVKSRAFVLIFFFFFGLESLHHISSLNSEFTPTYGTSQADSFATLGSGRQAGFFAKERSPDLGKQ